MRPHSVRSCVCLTAATLSCACPQARLASLPAVFLLSSPAVRCWADRLVGALLGGAVLGEPPLEEHQLEEMLQVRGVRCAGVTRAAGGSDGGDLRQSCS